MTSSHLKDFLHEKGIPLTGLACSCEEDGCIFDGELVVPGRCAMGTWRTLRDLVPDFPYWPVLMPSPVASSVPQGRPLDPGNRWAAWSRELRELRARGDIEMSPPIPMLTPDLIRADARTNIDDAARLRPEPWSFRRFGTSVSDRSLDVPSSPLPVSEPNLDHLFSNEGPFFAARRSASMDEPFLPFVAIRLFPTVVPWEVFAYRPFGGWNDAPWPDEVLTMFSHWHEQYGTEVVAIGDDFLEAFTPRPPRTLREAARLKEELGCFGEESPLFRAPRDADPCEYLARQHWWYFWWD